MVSALRKRTCVEIQILASKDLSLEDLSGTARSNMDNPEQSSTSEVLRRFPGDGERIPVVIFTVLDPEGYDLVLDSERWAHITDGHPEMVEHLERLRATLSTPQVIQRETPDSETHYYYRLTDRSFKHAQDIYINAVVRRVENERRGAVKTAFLVKTIREHGEIVWMNVKRN
ncbi:hypothetical protein HDF16_001619 [Granulicella aggregans]|uniref:Uncharacterized protein n=1 Tax=Granulicella aggregans TaxID=474949 RepID=A0A7W7ZBM2_9BACT|nr:hypothetical protein [Granulicella aggregans]